MSELKPCPFCGASAEVKSECNDYFERDYYVSCNGCEALMQFGASEEDVVASWNRRVAEAK